MYKTIMLLGAFLLISACSNGGDSGENGNSDEVQGLILPKAINVAAPVSTNNTAQATASSLNIVTAANATDPGTDYSNDNVEYYSGNNSFFNLDMVNGLLCLLDKLQITDLVNQGAYIARMQVCTCRMEPALSMKSR